MDPRASRVQVGKFASTGIRSPERPVAIQTALSGYVLEKACTVDVRLVSAVCQPQTANDRRQ